MRTHQDDRLRRRCRRSPPARRSRRRNRRKTAASGKQADGGVRRRLLLVHRSRFRQDAGRHLDHLRLYRRADSQTPPTSRSRPAAPAISRRCTWSTIRRASAMPSLSRRFLPTIDVTDGGGQFCDRGESYRPAIFVAQSGQAAAGCRQALAQIDQARIGQPIAVTLLPAGPFLAGRGLSPGLLHEEPGPI